LVAAKTAQQALQTTLSAVLIFPRAISLRGGDLLEALMANGTVKWFNGQKGYGFIQPEEGGNDVFVHISAVERAGLQTLKEGQKIAFDTERGRNGKIAAINLRPL
jgi:cold shock protein